MMKTKILTFSFWMLIGIASISPLLKTSNPYHSSKVTPNNPLPPKLQDLDMFEVELSQDLQRFSRSFPGSIQVFDSEVGLIILRTVHRPTRSLHPAKDCLKSIGFHVKSMPLWEDSQKKRWSSLQASSHDQRIRVRERIYDSAGNSWTDVSSWFWHAILGYSDGSWTMITIIEPLEDSSLNSSLMEWRM